jgi:peptide/nickel transport system substrate-binding protein
MAHFKGVKIVSTNPLVIETYDDTWYTDAELILGNGTPTGFNSWFPVCVYGPCSWHAMVPGLLADAKGELAFSTDKATEKKVEWMSYIAGPSLEILKKHLDQAQTDNFIPYSPTLSLYIKADEAKTRYTNLENWYGLKKHFWVGTGPFYVDGVFPTEQTMTLRRYPGYPDLASKWAGFGEPKLATAVVDGPGNVTIGQAGTFNVHVTFKDQPYPKAEIASVSYLVFNGKGDLVATGKADAVSDGEYKVTLGADVTKGLEAGSNKIEVAVSPIPVSVPAFSSFEFVTAP